MSKLKISDWRIPALILLLISVAFACRKMAIDEISPLSNVNEKFSPEVAKAFFADNFKRKLEGSSKVSGNSGTPKAFEGKFNIKWRLARSFKLGRFEMVEAPMRFERIHQTMYSFGGNEDGAISAQQMAEATFLRYVMYRDREGKVLTRILTFIPDKEYIKKYGLDASKNGADHLERNFSGYVEFRTWDQRSLFVYRIKGGKAVKRLKLLKRAQSAKISGKQVIMSTNTAQSSSNSTQSACNQVCDPTYEMQCSQGDYNSESSTGYDINCEQVVTGWECYDDPFCDSGPGDDPGYDPCDNPSNYQLPECGYIPDPCLDYGQCGGDPPSPPVTSDITENITNPCLQTTYNAITNTGNINNKVNNLIQGIFNKSDKVNLVYNQSTNLSSTTMGNTTAGYSGVDASGAKIYNVNVDLNVNVLPGYSQELTAVTILHEALHGYFNYNGLFVNEPLAQHLVMATKYVDLLRASVKSAYPNLQDKDANMLILSEMADIYAQAPSTFTTLLAQYNITPTYYNSTLPTFKSGSAGTRCPNP